MLILWAAMSHHVSCMCCVSIIYLCINNEIALCKMGCEL